MAELGRKGSTDLGLHNRLVLGWFFLARGSRQSSRSSGLFETWREEGNMRGGVYRREWNSVGLDNGIGWERLVNSRIQMDEPQRRLESVNAAQSVP